MNSGTHAENPAISCKRKISCYVTSVHKNLVTSSNQSHLDYSRKDRSALADLASVVQGITLLSYLIQSLLLKVTACFPPALQERRHRGGRGWYSCSHCLTSALKVSLHCATRLQFKAARLWAQKTSVTLLCIGICTSKKLDQVALVL